MNRNYRKLAVAAMLMVVAVGCGTGSVEREAIPSWWPNVDQASLEIVNLDSANKVIIQIGPELGIDDGQHSLLLSKPSSIVQLSDGRFLIADVGLSALVVSNEGISLSGVIGREGKGPVEFTRPKSMAISDSLIFVLEFGERVQVLNNHFDFVSSFHVGTSLENVATSQSFLFAPVSETDEGLIGVYERVSPFKQLGYVLPPIVFNSSGNKAFNHALVAANSASDSFHAAYVSQPILFKFGQELTTERVFRLEGRLVDDFEAQDPDGLDGGSSTMVWSFFQGLYTPCPNVVMFGHRNRLFALDLDSLELTEYTFQDGSGKPRHFSDIHFVADGVILIASIHDPLIWKGEIFFDVCR